MPSGSCQTASSQSKRKTCVSAGSVCVCVCHDVAALAAAGSEPHQPSLCGAWCSINYPRGEKRLWWKEMTNICWAQMDKNNNKVAPLDPTWKTNLLPLTGPSSHTGTTVGLLGNKRDRTKLKPLLSPGVLTRFLEVRGQGLDVEQFIECIQAWTSQANQAGQHNSSAEEENINVQVLWLQSNSISIMLS